MLAQVSSRKDELFSIEITFTGNQETTVEEWGGSRSGGGQRQNLNQHNSPHDLFATDWDDKKLMFFLSPELVHANKCI